MTYRGDYDPSGFDAALPSSWPPMPAGGYSPGDWWRITAAGSIGPISVDVGWRLFPIGTGRLYGELNYGDATYGGAVPAPPWPADANRVRWAAREWSSFPAWQRPPAPYSGQPFGETGWRLCLEYFLPVPAARLYGELTYGDAVYGDTTVPAEDWFDATCELYSAQITIGGDAAPAQNVDQLTVELLDPTGDALNIGHEARRDPQLLTPVRLSLIDPAGDPHPLFTGRIETLEDVADRPPRTVTLRAYGMTADLVTSRWVGRGEEEGQSRLAWLLARGRYRWGSIVPTGPLPRLRRIDPIESAEILAELDRAALSLGLAVFTDQLGVVRFRDWPIVGSSPLPEIQLTDRLGTSMLPAISISYVHDSAELVNVAQLGSEAVQGAAELAAEAADLDSVARWRARTDALGLPRTDLSARRAELDALADQIVARHGRIVSRVDSFDVSTDQDPRWLPELADLFTGRLVRIHQTVPRAQEWSAVIVGLQTSITARPARIEATVTLSTLTTTD